MREWRTIVLGALCVTLAACGGGSGSTGLVTSEGAVIDGVRTTGTCDTFDGAPYCATDSADAVAPGGQSVSVVTPGPTPQPTSTPVPAGSSTAAMPTPSAGAGPTATGAPATASPVPMPTTTPPPPRQVIVVVDGFDAGAACATAARTLGSEAPWETGPLALVDAGAPTTFLVATDVPAPLDLALLCFEEPPDALPTMLTTLADPSPTVVFVLPSP